MPNDISITCRGGRSDEFGPPRGSAFEFYMVWIDACVDDIGDCALACSIIVVRIAVWVVRLNLSGLGNTLQSPRGAALNYQLAMREVTDWLDGQDLKSVLSVAKMCNKYRLNTNLVHLLNLLLRLEIEFA